MVEQGFLPCSTPAPGCTGSLRGNVSEEPRSSWFARLIGKSGGDATDGTVAPEDEPHGPVNCNEVRSSASELVDGDVSTSFVDVVKRHLGLCNDCDGWVKSFATTVGLVKQVPQEEVPESLRQKIRDLPRTDQ